MAIDWNKLDAKAGLAPTTPTAPTAPAETPIADPTDVNVQKTNEDAMFAQLDAKANAIPETDFAALDSKAGIASQDAPTGVHSEPVPEPPKPLTPEDKDNKWLSDKGFSPNASYLLKKQEGVKYKQYYKGSWSVKTPDEEKNREAIFAENLKKLPLNHPVRIAHRKWEAYNNRVKKVMIAKGLMKPDKEYSGVWNTFTDSFKSSTFNVAAATFGTLAAAAKGVGDVGIVSSDDLQKTADNIYQKSQQAAPAKGGGWQAAVANIIGQTLPYSLASVGARVLTGSMVPAFGVSFAVEGDSEYRSIKQAGGSEAKAQMGRVMVGGINAAIETLQVSQVINFAKPSNVSVKKLASLAIKGSWKRLAKNAGKLSYESVQLAMREGLEEALQQTASVAGVTIAVPSSFDAGNALKQIGLSGLGGVVAGLALGGAGRVLYGSPEATMSEMRPKRESSDIPTMIEAAEGTIGYESADFDSPAIDDFAQKLLPIKKTTKVKIPKKKKVVRNIHKDTFKTIVAKHNEAGGSTVNLETGQPVESGYAVAVDTGKNKSFEKILPTEHITESDVKTYAKEHKADLEADKGRTIGTWVQDGKTYLDISEVVDDEFKAMELARETDQKAIYNLSNNEELPVEAGAAPLQADNYGEARAILNGVRSSTEKGITKKNKPKVVKALTDSLSKKYKKDVIGLHEGFWKKQLTHAGKQVKKFHYWMAREYQMFRALDGGKDGVLVNFFYKTKKDKVVEAHIKNANTMTAMRQALTARDVNFDTFFKPNIGLEVNGHTYHLSPSQRVEVYLSTLNPNNLRHLQNNGMTDEQINEIATSLTEPEQKVAEWLLNQYQGAWDEISNIYAVQTGKKLGKPKNFSPIVTDRDFLNFKTDFEESLFDRKMIKKRGLSSGELKKRLNSTSPLKLNGAIENYIGYKVHTNMYTSLALVADDIGSVLNDRTFQQKLKNATNHGLAKDMRKTLADTLSNTTRAEVDLIDKITNSLRRNGVTFLLGGNIVTMARQPMSMFLAAADNPRLVPFMVRNMVNLIRNYTTMKADVYEKSPMVATRSIERELKEAAAYKSAKHALKGTKSFKDLSFAPLQFMDRSTVVVVWQSAYDLSLAQGNTEFESRDYADSIVTRTQPMAGFEDLPPAFRGGAVSKLFSAFQNQVNQNYNYWAYDIYGAKKAGRLSNKELGYRILMGHIVPAFLLGVVSRGRMPDKKELLADEFGYFAGMYYFFGQWINSAIKGYSASNISAFTGLDNINRMASTKDPIKRALFFAKGAGAITGLPINQGLRSLEGCMELWDGKTDDVMRVIYSKAQRQGMKDKEVQHSLARIKGGNLKSRTKGRRGKK